MIADILELAAQWRSVEAELDRAYDDEDIDPLASAGTIPIERIESDLMGSAVSEVDIDVEDGPGTPEGWDAVGCGLLISPPR